VDTCPDPIGRHRADSDEVLDDIGPQGGEHRVGEILGVSSGRALGDAPGELLFRTGSPGWCRADLCAPRPGHGGVSTGGTPVEDARSEIL
jgi:hypothetical protein